MFGVLSWSLYSILGKSALPDGSSLLDYHGDFFMIYGALLTFSPRLKIKNIFKLFIIALFLIVPIYTFSRTLLLTFVIMAFIILSRRSKDMLVLASVIFVACVLIAVLDKDRIFFAKIENTFNEMRFSEQFRGYGTVTNWRGYESKLALELYKSFGTPGKYLFGSGFGTGLELNFLMTFNDVQMDYLPILHNGYLYLLVKSGLVGMLLFLFFLIYFCLDVHSVNKASLSFEKRLIFSTMITLALNTFVLTGLYNKQVYDPIIMLIGIYYSYLLDISNETNKNISRRSLV